MNQEQCLKVALVGVLKKRGYLYRYIKMEEDWQKAAERNKSDRIKWRKILGCSLSRFVYNMRELE